MDVKNKSHNIIITRGKASPKNKPLFVIPSLEKTQTINLYAFKLTELKSICKYYNIKNYSKLNKQNIIDHIKNYSDRNKHAIFIQKNIRRFLVQRFFENKSPNRTWLPTKRKEMCKNDSDFYTLEPLEEIPLSQYICYVDENNCYWGFDMLSLYNYYKHQYKITKQINKLNNPYTGLLFSETFIVSFKNHIKNSKHRGFDIKLDIEKQSVDDVNDLLINVLNIIEQHGYLMRNEWITNMTKEQLFKFIFELKDIWVYRAQLTINMQRQICHPSGNPFEHIGNIHHMLDDDYAIIYKKSLTLILNMISKGLHYSDCGTGILFVLSALTLASHEVALAYPWILSQAHY